MVSSSPSPTLWPTAVVLALCPGPGEDLHSMHILMIVLQCKSSTSSVLFNLGRASMIWLLILPLCAVFRPTTKWLSFLGICGMTCNVRISVMLLNLDCSATDLGVQTWYADKLGPEEVLSLSYLMGHFILARLEVRETEYWFTVAYDHVGLKTTFISLTNWPPGKDGIGCHRRRGGSGMKAFILHVSLPFILHDFFLVHLVLLPKAPPPPQCVTACHSRLYCSSASRGKRCFVRFCAWMWQDVAMEHSSAHRDDGSSQRASSP